MGKVERERKLESELRETEEGVSVAGGKGKGVYDIITESRTAYTEWLRERLS